LLGSCFMYPTHALPAEIYIAVVLQSHSLRFVTRTRALAIPNP
jgi:hypothetical protein